MTACKAADDVLLSKSMLGRTIAHYRILGPLGAGGLGVVFKAAGLRLGRPAALKRLQREAQLAPGLSHPNICVIRELGEHEGRPYVAVVKA